ncbi:hypothetical protein [Massilia glaciei]|uniref:Uncharacterized protein n=1 Tax=Massilia glaciei TaxID=1524097 RepID=A0A2U2I5D8_9BURK|nr:hypothetical protein [Massilia glaciei]PWF54849.1 hypothetical protein C7C56_004675 [Massilia glaciei]
MSEHSHYSTHGNGICSQCGQALPDHEPSYRPKGPNKRALAAIVALHVLLIVLFLINGKLEKKAAPPPAGGITYVSPMLGKPQPKVAASKPAKPVKNTPPPKVRRLPDTITVPPEKPEPVEVVRKEEPKPPEPVREPIPENMDMAAYVAAQKAKRGAASDQVGETENERGNRLARANVAAANGRSVGDDSNDTGGVFSIANQTGQSADVKFRGWNPNFKRRWLQQVTVEVGLEKDIETAIIKKMIELIRKEKKGDFEWDSNRLQRVVTMSARVEDTEALHAFLYKEMFPSERRGGRR